MTDLIILTGYKYDKIVHYINKNHYSNNIRIIDSGEVFNAGTNEPISVRNLLENV